MLNISNKYLAIFICVLSMVGCGSGEDSNSNPVTQSQSVPTVLTYTIQGTVPGTIIEAYCRDGSYYKQNSTNNGTVRHPFSLELPQNLDCKLVMITNETAPESQWIITPLEFSMNGETGTYISLNEDVDLGFVPLSTSNNSNSNIIETRMINLSNSNLLIKKLANDFLDNDNDGIPNIYEDDDNDGLIKRFDNDEKNSNDRDSDGIEDRYDIDDDNDGIRDDEDDDDDNDGIKDSDDSDHDEDNEYKNDISRANFALPARFVSDTSRVLVSQCAQCHGTNGNSSSGFDSIIKEEVVGESFHEDLIMQAQIDGYTITELRGIETWLNSSVAIKSFIDDDEEEDDDD